MRRVRRPTPARLGTRNAGFTLLEVLLTAILSATLLAGLWSLFGTYLRLFESGQARVERAQLLRALTRQMSDDLHGVVITNGTNEKKGAPATTDPNRFSSDALNPAFEAEAFATANSKLTTVEPREDVPQFCLVGNRTMLRLEVLTPASPLDGPLSLEATTTARLGDPAELRPNASELRTILYSFEQPREVSESDREPPPGLLRRELTWEKMQATARGAGARSTASRSAEEAAIGRGFVALTPVEAQEADQFDDSIIWTPEVVALRFRYFDGQAWFNEWDSRQAKSLPAAVEIAMRLQPVDETRQSNRKNQQASDTDPSTDNATQTDDATSEIGDDLLTSDDTSTDSSADDESGLPLIRELVLLQSPTKSRDNVEQRSASFFANTTSGDSNRE